MASPIRPDVALLFPPQWTPQNPPFALGSLGGHLRSRGIQTRLVDLNLAYYEEVLTPDHLAFCGQLARSRAEHLRQKCQMRMLLGFTNPALEVDAAHLLRLESFLECQPDPWTEASRTVLGAVAVVRDCERFYDPKCLVPAMATIDRALELVASPYEPARLALNSFSNPRYPLTVDGMERATRDLWGNPFLNFMRRAVPDILRLQPRLLALSISSFSQVLAGLTLARLLKSAAPDTHMTLGGNFFGRVADRIYARKEFFHLFCDSLVVGEGEVTLERLAQAIVEGRPVEDMPGVVTAEAMGPPRSRRDTPLEQVGPIDLADLPLQRYFSPEPVVCIQASRGCYWGQCTFCDSYWGVTLDKKSPARLIQELRHLRNTYGIRHFEFIDECLPPAEMGAMARAIQEAGLDLRWFANARSETGFLDVLADLPGAGATMLLWGFESGSERILKLLAKGVHPQRRWEVLRASAGAGLWNFAYIFFGFPGETREEAVQTIDALCHNTDVLHSYGRSVYTLGRHSPMASKPEDFGISDLVEGGTDLSVNLTYSNSAGPTPVQVEESTQLCIHRCREAYGDPLWMVLRNRENLHLYLARFGSERVRHWSLEAELIGQGNFQK